jgi:lysophospholipase L1-like esterase
MKKLLIIIFAFFVGIANAQLISTAIDNTRPAPINAPVITGTNAIGNNLTATGVWGNSPNSYTYQWKVDGVNITGATSSTYALGDLSAGNDITCVVTPIKNTGNGQSRTSSITSIDWPSTAAIGVIYTDNFNRSSPGSDYSVTAPAVTFSQNGAYLRAARATTGGFANYIQLLKPSSTQGFNSEKFKATLRFRVVTTSVGLSVGWKSISGNSVVDITGLMQTGSPSTTLARAYQNGSALATSSTFSTVNGDQCEVEIYREPATTITVTARKLNGSPASASINYAFPTGTGSPLAWNISQLAIYFNGGTYDLESFTIEQELLKYSRVCFVGNSITQWYFASIYQNRYAAKSMVGSSYPYIVMAGQGQRTAEILNNVDEIVSVRPRYVVLMIGTNDIGTGVSSATWQANYSSFVESMISNGIRVVLCYVTPRNTYDFRPTTVGSPNKWILDTYGADSRVQIIDTYTPLKDAGGNGIDATYSSDGIHPNNAGTTVLANTIQAAIPTILGI